MSDDDKTPVDRPRKRPGRDYQKPKAGAVPEFVAEDVTDQYEGEELQAMRSKRDTHQRVARLEIKHDRLSTAVANVSGHLTGQDRVLDNIQKSVDSLSAKDLAVFSADVSDRTDRRKASRERVTKVIGFVFGGGFLVQVLHWLGVL